jgi:antimicrobial peptide system SdpA family protein
LILAFTAIIQIENNLISDRIDKKYVTLARIVLPQGWNFFTKPPTDSFLMVYRGDASGHLELLTNESSSPEARLGLSRNVRARGIEIGHIAPQLNQSRMWKDCKARDTSCLRFDRSAKVSVNNPVAGADLCGKLIIAEQSVRQESVSRIYRSALPHRKICKRPSLLSRSTTMKGRVCDFIRMCRVQLRVNGIQLARALLALSTLITLWLIADEGVARA